jgi:tRNA(Ile)-lysidine synthase
MASRHDNLESALATAWPAEQWRDVHVVLAVSGGADSVAMLRLMADAKRRAGGAGRLIVAHLNHGIRPVESAVDAAWLADLCQRLELPCEIGTADVPGLADRAGDGIEAAARAARYQFLLETAERFGARFVAVAHTADDQAETVLHRFLRGTGIAGLAGMPRGRRLSPAVQLVRPLLDVLRHQIEQYLAALGQDFRTDATNTDCQFTRNRLRHELLPLLRADFNSDVDAALERLAQQAAEVQQLITSMAGALVEQAIQVEIDRLRIDRRQLAAEPPLIVREASKLAWVAVGWPLQNMGFDEWQQLHALIVAEISGPLNLPHGLRAEIDGDQIKVARIA